MTDETVHGVVIRYANYSESSRMLTLLTPGEGLVSAVAKGARRLKSPLRTSSEMFSFAVFGLHQGRGRSRIVTSAELIDSFYELRTDLDRLSCASEMAELVLALAPEGDPQPELFSLFVRSLSALSHDGEDPFRTGLHFQTCAMASAGYAAETERCSVCGRELGSRPSFSPGDGGAVCTDCALAAGLPSVNPGSLRMLRNMRLFDVGQLHVLSVPAPQQEEIRSMWRGYMELYLEKHFRSPEFSKRLERFSLRFGKTV